MKQNISAAILSIYINAFIPFVDGVWLTVKRDEKDVELCTMIRKSINPSQQIDAQYF